jgi:hypothetical protein
MTRPRKNPLTFVTDPLVEYPPLISATQTTMQNTESKDINSKQDQAPSYRYQQQVDFWKRDEYGLLPNVEYKFCEDKPHKIDWRAMVDIKHILINQGKFPKDTDFSTLNIEELEDNQLLLSLVGFKKLLELRGFTAIRKYIDFAHETFAAVRCEIDLVPMFEHGMQPITVCGEGDASLNNTKGFGQKFLVAVAANRALERALKDALGLHDLLGEDEPEVVKGIAGKSSPSAGIPPRAALVSSMQKAGISFDQIKKRYIQEGSRPDSTTDQIEWKNKAENWIDESSPTPLEIFVIIKRLNDKIKAKEQQKSYKQNPFPE